MKIKKRISKWSEFLKKDALECAYELGATGAYLKVRILEYWDKTQPVLFPFLQDNEKPRFKKELRDLLGAKYKKKSYLKIPAYVFSKLCKEMYDLLLCSVASERSPDEIIDGLRSDLEMRREVVDLLISKVNSKTSVKAQRMFLDGIFSGDKDLKRLLNEQKAKKGFPYDI